MELRFHKQTRQFKISRFCVSDATNLFPIGFIPILTPPGSPVVVGVPTMGAMGFVYDAVYVVVALVSSPLWGYRLWRTGKWRTDWHGRLGWVGPGHRNGRSTLLIHAVSVGEVNAVGALVRMLHQRCGGAIRIVVSTTTDTGTARARQLFEPTHQVVRYPLDWGFCVKRFLDTVRPDAVALTELEVWPNFVAQCSRRGVPVCVINGRLSARSFRWYRWVAKWVRPVFAKLTVVAAQTHPYAQRFVAMGVDAERVRVFDSMKWDGVTVAPSGDGSGAVPGAEAMGMAMGIDRSRPVIVAGSTGPGEEQMLIDSCPTDAQLVLVPRRPERFDQVASLRPGLVRRSQHPDGTAASNTGSRLFLLDTIGELTKAYALADIAVVGRSFMGQQHGSNPLEPVALGVPTLIGPHHDDFADVVGSLQAAGGIVVTTRPGPAAVELLADKPRRDALVRGARGVIVAHRGATKQYADLLLEMLPSIGCR